MAGTEAEAMANVFRSSKAMRLAILSCQKRILNNLVVTLRLQSRIFMTTPVTPLVDLEDRRVISWHRG